MKVITVEEHFATPDLMAAWEGLAPENFDDTLMVYKGPPGVPLLDLGEQRLRWMDEMGVDIQVLSVTTPGVQPVDPAAAVELAGRSNDLLAETVRANPDRFQGFATLPTPDPEAAAAELRRAVGELGLQGGMAFGRTRERNIDHPDNEPIFAAAAALRAPLFLHPQLPQRGVRDALYSGLPGKLDLALATAGVGWHYEAGVQFIRLILSGVLDRHPDLRIILGHWGDLVTFYIDEMEVLAKVSEGKIRPIADYFREHVYIVPSGTLTHRYLPWANEVLGPDRLLFGLDYPFVPRKEGDVERFFADAPIGEVEKRQMAAENWEGLVAGIRA
jgi:uncharacterized protein